MKFITSTLVSTLIVMLASCDNKTNETPNPMENQTTKNEVIETIMQRRSIRQYKDLSISRDTLKTILECGINAPNGQNKQSWEIRVVDNPDIMKEIKDIMVKANPETDPEMVKGCFRGAPVMVFIARDIAYPFSTYDCGLMAENMMLSAQSMGIGSICLGSPVMFINNNPACQAVLDKLAFSPGYELSLCVGFGYADETPDAKPRDWNKVKFLD